MTVDDEHRHRQALMVEAKRIEDVAQEWYEAQRNQAWWWRRWNTLSTVASGVLVALAGATVLGIQ